jgi:multidrug efflux pump subunit AcrB
MQGVHTVRDGREELGRDADGAVVLDEAKLAAYGLTAGQVLGGIQTSNRTMPSGGYAAGNKQYLVETGEFLRTADDVRNVVVGVANGRPVYLRDIATVRAELEKLERQSSGR